MVNQINLSTEGITINANKINIVGAVTVLSDITGNLGTLTAGNIDAFLVTVSNIDESNELILSHYDRWEDAYRDHFTRNRC